MSQSRLAPTSFVLEIGLLQSRGLELSTPTRGLEASAPQLDASAATEHIVEQASAASAVATRLAESSQQGRTHATEPSCPDKIVFDRLFENPRATTSQLLRWASSIREIPVVADTLRKLGEWNAVTKKLGTHKQLHALAKSHGISITRHVVHARAAESYPTWMNHVGNVLLASLDACRENHLLQSTRAASPVASRKSQRQESILGYARPLEHQSAGPDQDATAGTNDYGLDGRSALKLLEGNAAATRTLRSHLHMITNSFSNKARGEFCKLYGVRRNSMVRGKRYLYCAEWFRYECQ